MGATTTSARPRSEALAALAGLPVKGRAPKTGYDREEFGTPWLDIDQNGCDTRNDVLARVLQSAVFDASCAAVSGTLLDLYSGRTERFAPDDPSATAIDIDHVVALGDAWQKGAQQLDLATRIQFANDPMNLVAVAASLNRQKGDGDAATWLPPDRSYRCTHVATQIAVKSRYLLWVAAAERDAMERILAGCPGQVLPESERPPLPTVDPTSGPTSAGPPGSPPANRPYRNCADARAAGDAPLYRGDPGYSPDLDGDGDGIACE